MLVMEETDHGVVESVSLLFGKVEAVEAPKSVMPYDQNVGPEDIPDVREAESRLKLQETSELNEVETRTQPFANEEKANDITEVIADGQILFTQRRRSISLLDITQKAEGEEEERQPFIVRQPPPGVSREGEPNPRRGPKGCEFVRQRTHPRARHSERRRTILSGLNLLLPRKDLECEDSSDVTDAEKESPDTPLASAEIIRGCNNDEGMKTGGTSNNAIKDEETNLETALKDNVVNGIGLVNINSDTVNAVEKTVIHNDCTEGSSSVILSADEYLSVPKDDRSTTMSDDDSVDNTAGPSRAELESSSSGSPPPLPQGSPPDISLLGQDSLVIFELNQKPHPARETGTEESTNFADKLISALSSTTDVADAKNSDADDSDDTSESSTNLKEQKPDQPESLRDEEEISASVQRSLTSHFDRLHDMRDKENQFSHNQVDRMSDRDTKLSRSESCLLQRDVGNRMKSRDQRSKMVSQTGSKTDLAASTENASEISGLGSSVDKLGSTEGMRLAFSTSCLADATIDNEFLHFIQKEARIKASAEVVHIVQNIDFMTPAELNMFEEFCENFCDGQSDDFSSDQDFQDCEDQTQKLITHLLSKSVEEKSTETSVDSLDGLTPNRLSTERSLNNSVDVESSARIADISILDSMIGIVPSALLAQSPKSFARMSSLNENEIDHGTHQHLCHESDASAKKDNLTLILDHTTDPVRDFSAPPLPPKSSSFRHARESLKIEFSERRGRSLNLEDDMRSSSPPPLPPRRGGSLVISGTAEMTHRLPSSSMTTRMSSIAGTPNNENTQTLPVFRASKRPRHLRDRNCMSSVIPDNENLSPIEKNNFSDPNLSSTTIASLDPPELPPRNGPSVSFEHSRPILISEYPVQEPPPRPPPFFRSMSTREGGLEKAATFVMTSHDYPISGRTSFKKKYGDQLAHKEWIEARNDMIDVEIIPSAAASSIPPLDPYTEPPFQHFPVKHDGTHHRLSTVSNSSSECHTAFQSHYNGAFHLTEDEKLELVDPRSDSHAIKQRALYRQKSSSSSETDSTRKFNPPSRTSSSNSSGRKREKFLAGFKADGTTTSSVNLLSHEAPVPCNATAELRASSVYDLSADNLAFVRDRQGSTASSVSDDQAQATRGKGMAKRLSDVYAVVGWTSRKKEDKKPSKTKEVHLRNLMTKFSFLRDTSARGVPSDLNTLMDSALNLNEFENNEGNNQNVPGRPAQKVVDRKQRSRASLGEEILRRCDLMPPEPSTRYSAGTADQMAMMITPDEVDDNTRQEANNNTNQKNSDRIILALSNLKRDMMEYTRVLESLQNTYEEMRSKTPDGIRQRFDLAFKEVKVMHQLQLELNSRIVRDDVDLSVVAEAFKTKDFSTYKRYSILARDLQKEIKSHSSYFSENFRQFSSNIMKPFHRLNTYSQYLQSFLNNYLDETESKLQEAVAYLNNLKQEANTEMNICDMQKCPVELRLAGLISFSGHLHYDGDLLPKQVYVMLFESILVICEDNHEYRVYKQHYRSEQVAEIKEAGDLDIEVRVHPTHQSDTIQLKFKANLASERKTWMARLRSWQERNLPSFKTISLNSDLQRNIHRKHDRFLPLSLWMLSPSLKATVDAVKHNRFDEKTIKLNKIHNISRPNSGEDAIFNSFMVNVEEFVSRLDVLLDQEARAPPQLLGSILRKLRRFYKSVFLPQLRADFEKQPERILESIVGHLPNFPPLFREYIEVRSGLTLVMEDGLSCNQYISPFKHLSFFIEWLFTLSCIAKYHVMLRGQLAILVNCVEDARVTLLHSAIVNCQLDFYKTGDIVRNGCLESKVKCKAIRGNQDYHVILFEKAILFTRAKIPQYEFVQILWLDQMTFGPQPDHKCSFKLEERAAKKIYVYELKAKSEEQKKDWQNDIHKQLHRQVEFVKKNLS